MSHRRKAVISTKRDRADEDDVIDGSVLSLAQDKSQIIRVFISSTFSDTCSERNILMEKAYPRLKDYCRQYDLEFQAYDLRWGIRDVSHDDHSIVDFCLREIEQCKQLSAGPSIVALIGQKYGYRPYPSRICADEFEMLL
ncbi:hypothetical protein HELRODRAFT_84545, partial [Helobdella robusta]|uniref:DUF4062 domain-containing protein n=1 Tax=Helobdella robusta TaxID=6412 RepID=T1G5K2_HELRO